jgi:serine/threonine-protein kinase RsbW
MKSPREQVPASFRETIPSRLDEAELLCLRIRRMLENNDLPMLCFPVELLARECLANAIKHGNRNDAAKSIVLRFLIGREWIRLQVSDEGSGFAWQKTYQERLSTTKPSGRGLRLYELYAERVRFNRCGNQITLWISKKNRRGKDDSKMAAFVIEQNDRQGSVKLSGDLTAILVPDLQAGLKEALGKGVRDLVFDLGSATMLDSSGMGLLIATANSVAPNGGKVRVTNVCPDIFRLLQSMRLTARLNVSARAE